MEKMSLTELEGLFPKISSSSSIQELIKFLEYSFLKSEFDEVQNILTERENNMKVERESFERDRRTIKKEFDLLEQDKLVLEGKLKEKSKMILQLNQKIKELENQKLESEKTAVKYEEKIKSMNDEAEKLKCEKLETDQTVEVYKKRFEDLSARFRKAEQILANIFKVGINDLSNLANNMEKDVVNFSNSYGEKESSSNGGKWSEGNADFGKADLEHFRNERSLNSGGDVGDTLPMVHPACKSGETGIHGLQGRGGGNLVLSSQTKEAGANGYDASQGFPGKQSAGNRAQTESRQAIIVALDHGEQGINNLMLARSSSKMAQSQKSGDIIEISDSDDEATPEKFIQSPTLSQTNRKNRADCKDGSLVSSKPTRKRSTYGSDNDENFPIGAQKEKRTREVNYDGSGSLINNLVNPKSVDANLAHTVLPSMHNPVHFRRCEEKAEAKRDSQTPSQASDGINVNDSTDSEDESFSSFCINNMVGSLQVKKKSKAWMFGADMIQDFEEDPKLCLNAVCALHRQQISAAKSNVGSQSGVLGHRDVLSIGALGEYLTEGDPHHRLRKSVSEVEQQRPDPIKCTASVVCFNSSISWWFLFSPWEAKARCLKLKGESFRAPLYFSVINFSSVFC
ncbi:unnamed protein product [Fraxinus pennsylvanica]|uniref:Uncharacterized protein n=1 Tax=Fraxinus pennsylvanica TaxID=56036 RepID=A0AAD2EEC3_9LAMI|nr:unnamed protein product [Fraxinus pennsylvanica]